jgi:hypothetical protein
MRQDSSRQLLESMSIWISPHKGRKVLELQVDRDSEESIFYVQECEMDGGTGDERQESVGVGHHRVYRSQCHIDEVEILHQKVRHIGLFYRQNRSVTEGVGWVKQALSEKL